MRRSLEPWDDRENRSRRGYGLEVIRRFFEEVAYVEFGGPADGRDQRLRRMRDLEYNDVSADRSVVAAVQAMEAILRRHAEGRPGCQAVVNGSGGGLVLWAPGEASPTVLYEPAV